MFEQDYIMRLIKEMVRTIFKLLFHVDMETETVELLEGEEGAKVWRELLAMVDDGKIDEAENRVYELTEQKELHNLKIALLFYSYLNERDDEFLKEHDFSREEVKEGLQNLAERYGLGGMSEVFLSNFLSNQ